MAVLVVVAGMVVVPDWPVGLVRAAFLERTNSITSGSSETITITAMIGSRYLSTLLIVEPSA